MNKETRYLDSKEFRAVEDGDARYLEGYAAVFNSRSELLGNFVEVIEPGAFADVLENDAVALLNHDANYPLARVSNGTLTMQQDDVGLKVRFKLPDTSYARDIWTNVRDGLLKQMSFAFEVGKDSWSKLQDGTALRTIKTVKRLYDVSPVTYPAYPETSIQARSMADEVQNWTKDETDAPKSVDDTNSKAELPTQEAERQRVLKLISRGQTK